MGEYIYYLWFGVYIAIILFLLLGLNYSDDLSNFRVSWLCGLRWACGVLHWSGSCSIVQAVALHIDPMEP